MRVTIADIGGIKTRYYHAGSGPPLLLLHGLAATADTFLCNIDALAEKFTVIAPDLIGRGLTDPVDLEGGPSQPKETAHLLALADHLGLERLSVVGGSYGGLAGMLLYLARPALVDRMVIVASGSGFNTEEQQVRMLADIEVHATERFGPGLDVEDSRSRFARIVHDPACLPEPMLYVIANLNAQPRTADFYRKMMNGMKDMDRVRPWRVIDRFAEIDLPVLIINGREDFLSSWERSEEVSRLLPDARLEVWENCGHLPYVEYPERFNATVAAFCLGGR
ncbi:MAG: alpha/beta hydrolase [Bauldia litoralis]